MRTRLHHSLYQKQLLTRWQVPCTVLGLFPRIDGQSGGCCIQSHAAKARQFAVLSSYKVGQRRWLRLTASKDMSVSRTYSDMQLVQASRGAIEMG